MTYTRKATRANLYTNRPDGMTANASEVSCWCFHCSFMVATPMCSLKSSFTSYLKVTSASTVACASQTNATSQDAYSAFATGNTTVFEKTLELGNK